MTERDAEIEEAYAAQYEFEHGARLIENRIDPDLAARLRSLHEPAKS